MFETIRMTVELMQAQHTIDHSQLSMLQFSELESSSSSSDFSLSDYADRYTTARDAYLEVGHAARGFSCLKRHAAMCSFWPFQAEF